MALILAAFLFSANLALAQPRSQQGPPPIPNDKQIEKMVTELSAELSLTDKQEKEVSALYTAHFDEARKKMKSGRPDRAEMEKLRSTFENDVKALLTDEQKELFKAFIKKQEAQRGNTPPKDKGRP